MARNYPDGMSEGDIPGYWDIECPYCEEDPDDECGFCEGTGMCDSRELDKFYKEEAAIRAAEDDRGRY